MKALYLLCCVFLLFSSCGKQEKLIPDTHDDWKLFTKTRLDYFIPGHEANYRIIYINSIGLNVNIKTSSQGKKEYHYPNGTILLKEIYPGMDYNPGEEPLRYTVMLKQPDHPAAKGGWVWLVKNHKTKDESIFRSDMCVNCHEGANRSHPYHDKNPDNEFRDYAFFTYDGPDDDDSIY